ncbi:MAG TPA: VWA domain-containing protein [Acidobacteriota bacterium]|nr:VWA domain-containing protein [Acidobacteriota bacterium]
MPTYRIFLFVIALFVLFGLAASDVALITTVRAQNQEDSERNREDPPQLPPTRTPRKPQFGVEVDQVVVYAAVYDKAGQLVTGLTKDDFTVLEDKVPQEISYFGLADMPSTVGIVVDCSGSMRQKIDEVIDAIKLFLSQNNPQNELFLIRFNDEVELEESFTNDPEDITDALDNLVVSGGTALYDAVMLAVEEARRGSEPRKAVIVFTDGEDKDSYYKHSEVLSKIQEADVQVHIVAFLDSDLSSEGGFFGIFKSEREKVTKLITDIAEMSGGRVIFPEKTEELKPAFEAIAQDLRNQYRLGYISSNQARDGSWRRVDVEVKGAKQKGFRVRAKKGYTAPKS